MILGALLLLLALAPAAHAAPIELRYDPGATAVALAGPDVIVLSETPTGGTKLVATPRSGALPARRLLELPDTGYAYDPLLLAASEQRVAAIVVTSGPDLEWTLFSGSPSGPPLPLERTPNPDGTAWQPVLVDVDGDRLLVVEAAPSGAIRARVHTPATGFVDIAWGGDTRVPLAIAGPYAAALRLPSLAVELTDLASGAVLATARGEFGDDMRVSVAPDGRIAVPTRAGILVAAPGVPQRLLPHSRGLTAPHFFGPTVAAIPARLGPLALLAADGTRSTLGRPSSAPSDIDADERGVVWLFNGCVRYSDRLVNYSLCRPIEVALRDASSRLVGLTARAPVRCVTASGRCRGTLLARSRTGRVIGRGRFAIPRGTERRVTIRFTRPPQWRSVPIDARVIEGRVGAGRGGTARLKLTRP